MGGAASAEEWRPFLGGGFTFGGDDITTLNYTNNDSQTIRAGALFDLRAGVDFRLVNSDISLQGAIAYHGDRSDADNGSADFSRIPIEFLVQWHPNDKWGVGVGIRKANEPKYNASGVGTTYGRDQKYSASTGWIVEGEYFIIPKVGLKLRYVNETYTAEDDRTVKKDGSHIGLLAVYYFN